MPVRWRSKPASDLGLLQARFHSLIHPLSRYSANTHHVPDPDTDSILVLKEMSPLLGITGHKQRDCRGRTRAQ